MADDALHVLIVDDALDVALIVRLILERDRTVRCTTVSSGFESLYDTLDWSTIDVAIVDQGLGDYDGKEILCWITEEHPHIRRIMLTADTRAREQETFAQLVLIKPVDAKDLSAAIREG